MLPLCALAVLVCTAFAVDPSINVNDNEMVFTVAGASLKLTSNCSALPVQPTATEAFVNAAASGIRDNLAIAVATQASATGASVVGLASAQGEQVTALATLVGQAIANVATLQATTLTQGAVDSALSSASSALAAQAASALASAASTAQAQAPLVTALATSAAQTAAVITALQNVTGATFDRLVTATQVSTQVAAVRTELSNTVTAQQAATVTAISSTLTATATGITSVVTGMDSRVAALTAAQSTLDSRLTDSSAVVEQIRQSASTTQSQVVAATARVTTLEGLVTGLSGLVVAVNSNASVQIQQTQTLINTETTRATGVEAAISTVATQISTRVSTAQANILSFTTCLTQGQAVNASFACVTSVNMCNPSVLGQTRYTTTMQYCDGTNWVAIPTGIGRSSVVPAYSCRQIYTLDNSATSGVYWLTGSTTTAWQAYCDMTDGGYTLVGMVASTDDDTWAYNGGLWTNAATLNDATTDPNTNVQFKSRFFNSMPFGTIKFVMNTITSTPFRYNANFASAASFFSAGTLGSAYGRATWIANVGVTSSVFDNEPNCNNEGVSFVISGNGGSSTGCRFGITMNNENDCLTNDAVIGFGCYYSYTGTTNMGCGAISWNPTNRYPKRGWIWVK